MREANIALEDAYTWSELFASDAEKRGGRATTHSVSNAAAAAGAATPWRRAPLTAADYAKSFVCGAFAGVCNCSFSYPLDTIKVRAQAVRLNPRERLSYPRIVSSILRVDGIRGLYRGIPSPMMGVICDNAAIFTVQSNVLLTLESMTLPSHAPSYSEYDRPVSHLLVAGTLAGFVSAIVLTPFELIKCRVQLAHHHTSTTTRCPQQGRSAEQQHGNSIGNVARNIYHQEGGVRGFFRGIQGTCVREVPGTLMWFTVYQLSINAWFHRSYPEHAIQRRQSDPTNSVARTTPPRPPMHVSMIAGGLAGCAYWTIAYPGDLVKTQMQSGLREFSGTTVGRGIANALKSNGIRGLYRGYGITIVRAFPSNGILFTAYEWASGRWDQALCSTATQ